ncbi:hypothetical protein [Burkholderia sp. PU8-34]
MAIEFSYRSAEAQFDDDDLNEEVLTSIRELAAEEGSAASYLFSGEDLLLVDDDGYFYEDGSFNPEGCFSFQSFVVVPLPGVASYDA